MKYSRTCTSRCMDCKEPACAATWTGLRPTLHQRIEIIKKRRLLSSVHNMGVIMKVVHLERAVLTYFVCNKQSKTITSSNYSPIRWYILFFISVIISMSLPYPPGSGPHSPLYPNQISNRIKKFWHNLSGLKILCKVRNWKETLIKIIRLYYKKGGIKNTLQPGHFEHPNRLLHTGNLRCPEFSLAV